jgi:D-lactate dehydratase
MSASLPRKALISISSYYGVIYPDGTRTGLFFTEALHPFEVLTQAGFEVDLATETGTYGLDDLSLTDRFLAGDDKALFEDPKHPFNVKLNSQLKKAADLKAEEYGLFFGSAGHAALYDYPTARGLQAVAENVWQRGGIVAAVCHRPVLLPGVIDSQHRQVEVPPITLAIVERPACKLMLGSGPGGYSTQISPIGRLCHGELHAGVVEQGRAC